jgi:hypothetical protein
MIITKLKIFRNITAKIESTLLNEKLNDTSYIKRGFMRKLILVIFLLFSIIPLFAQTDEYAKFQGVWCRTFDGREFPAFVFVNSIYMMISDYFIFGEYEIKDDKIILYPKNIFNDGSGLKPAIFEEAVTMKYLFSDEKLLIEINGEELTLKKM